MKRFTSPIIFQIFFSIIMIGVFANNASALTLPVSTANPVDYIKNTLNKYAPDTQGINTNVPSLGQNVSNGVQDLIKKGINSVSGNTTISSPNSNTTGFSTSDVPGALKAIATLAINLFLIVIQTVAGILKALLPFLSK